MYKPRPVKDLSKVLYTSCASAMPVACLANSPLLHNVWRVSFFNESNEFAPRKPFWYLTAPISLAEAGDMQRIA